MLRKTPFLKNSVYHVYSRGDRKEPIFFSPRDYQRFLEKVEEYRLKHQVEVISYCLLPNHFHLLTKQLGDIPIHKFMKSLLSSHSHYASLKYRLPPGHFFQGPFGSKLVSSDEDFAQTHRYIHLNPIKEKVLTLDFTYKSDRLIKNKSLINELRSYPWSSYQLLISGKKGIVSVINETILKNFKNVTDYKRFVEAKITDDDAFKLETF